jgi:hypothetical protein
MNGGSIGPTSINSYYDLQQMCPKNPLDLIAYAAFNGTVGSLVNSTTYNAESWTEAGGATVSIVSEPIVTALGTDSGQQLAYANQDNFSHLNWLGTVPPPLLRTIFLKAGTTWSNRITINIPSTVTEVQLSFLNNAATRGDAQGTIPVIDFTGSWSAGSCALDVVLKQPGCVRMGLWVRSGSTYYMFDMEWMIVS